MGEELPVFQLKLDKFRFLKRKGWDYKFKPDVKINNRQNLKKPAKTKE